MLHVHGLEVLHRADHVGDRLVDPGQPGAKRGAAQQLLLGAAGRVERDVEELVTQLVIGLRIVPVADHLVEGLRQQARAQVAHVRKTRARGERLAVGLSLRGRGIDDLAERGADRGDGQSMPAAVRNGNIPHPPLMKHADPAAARPLGAAQDLVAIHIRVAQAAVEAAPLRRAQWVIAEVALLRHLPARLHQVHLRKAADDASHPIQTLAGDVDACLETDVRGHREGGADVEVVIQPLLSQPAGVLGLLLLSELPQLSLQARPLLLLESGDGLVGVNQLIVAGHGADHMAQPTQGVL